MRKVIFVLCGFIAFILLMSVWSYLFFKEANTLYEDVVNVKVIYEPSKHVKTWGGKGLLGEVPEKYVVILKSQRGKRIIRDEKIYNEMKSWDGKTVHISFKEHPFQIVTIKSIKCIMSSWGVCLPPHFFI